MNSKPLLLNNYLLSLKKIGILLFCYQILRILFYILNRDLFDALTLREILGGLRFDVSIIIATNAPFFLVLLFPLPALGRLAKQKIFKYAFFTINGILFLISFVDMAYYRYTGVRSNFNLITAYGMKDDLFRLLSSYLIAYAHLLLLFVLFLLLFWFIIPAVPSMQPNRQKNKFHTIRNWFSFLLIATLLVFLVRGGIQRKPLSQSAAIMYADSRNVAVVLNTPYCVLNSLFKNNTFEEQNYFLPTELNTVFNPIKNFADPHPVQKKNIVILIFESFGRENIGYFNEGSGYTPFLDSLISKSLVYKNGFANGRLSIEAVPSVISGIPSLMHQPYISSVYNLNRTKSLPVVLKELGYNSAFFHGAFNGSQNFDHYSRIAGFDTYYGKNEYPSNDDYDGNWGIFDEPFFQFFCSKQSAMSAPFLSVLFSLSSHNPYTLPEKYIGQFPKGSYPIQETIGYTDYALRKYFETAAQQAWYHNTLFVLTADHSSFVGENFYKTVPGQYAIPIIFFDPANPQLKGVDERVFQQTDIMSFILNYIHYQGNYLSFGNDYGADSGRFAINFNNGTYRFIYDDVYIEFDGSKLIQANHWKIHTEKNLATLQFNDPDVLQAEQKLKAVIQSFNGRMIRNKLCP